VVILPQGGGRLALDQGLLQLLPVKGRREKGHREGGGQERVVRDAVKMGKKAV
jgi:hypothetical protein